MADKPYGNLCPISKACDILSSRWTIQILTELWCGSTRFNEIRRGLPGLSPTLLTKRLAEMQNDGLIERIENRATGAIDYIRTEKAIELEGVLNELAKWAQRHVEADIATEDRNAEVLMWNLRRKILPEEMPKRRNVLRFNFSDATSLTSTFWVITNPGEKLDLCNVDHGFDVDLYIETEVRVLTGIFLGRQTIDRAVENGTFFMTGDARLERTIHRWMKQSSYAEFDDIAVMS